MRWLDFHIFGCKSSLEKMGSSTSRVRFDLPRYLGHWYEAARYPNSFEIGCKEVSADYSWTSNQIMMVNRCLYPSGRRMEMTGYGSLIGGSTFKVIFPGLAPLDYTVLSTDYDNFAFVAGSGGQFWILSRRPTLTRDEQADVIERTRLLGYSPDHLIWNQ